MFGILISALNSFLGTALALIFSQVVVKFFTFTSILLFTTAICSFLLSSGLLPSVSTVGGYSSLISNDIGYYMVLFKMYTGISMIISAYATRFTIKMMLGAK